MASVVGKRAGFGIVVRLGGGDRSLGTTRGEERLFANLNTAALFLRDVGLPRFEVDITEFEPGRLRKARPDRADALRKTRTKPIQERLL
jgi:hypothetical protein